LQCLSLLPKLFLTSVHPEASTFIIDLNIDVDAQVLRDMVSTATIEHDLLSAHSTSKLLGNCKTVARELDWEW
jgi:hypothetical protein